MRTVAISMRVRGLLACLVAVLPGARAIAAETLALREVEQVAVVNNATLKSAAAIVPLAAQTVEMLQAGYRTDTSGYLELLTAQRTLREAEAAASAHLADYLAALAELEAVVGLGGESLKTKSPPRNPKK